MDTPLGGIDVDLFVEKKSLVDRGELPVISESPLRVMLHPSSNSFIARNAVNRLEQDVGDFAADENKGVLPVLKAINSTVGSLVGAALDRALSSMTSMVAALDKLRERDAAIVKEGVKELLDFCNSKVFTQESSVRAIAHSLKQKAGIEVPMVRITVDCECNSRHYLHDTNHLTDFLKCVRNSLLSLPPLLLLSLLEICASTIPC